MKFSRLLTACFNGACMIALAGATVSCGENSANSADVPAVDIAADRVVARLSASGDNSNQELSPELDLGAESSDSVGYNGLIEDVTAVDADSRGHIYVVDRSAESIKQFSPDGRFVRVIGRAGDGPGEFRQPKDVAVSSDTVFVLTTKVQLFDTAGHYLGSSMPHASANLAFANSFDATAAGIVFYRTTMGEMSPKYRDDTVRVFSLRLPGTAAEFLQIPQRQYFYGRGVEYPRVLSPGVVIAARQNGDLYYTVGDSFHINIADSTGTLKRTIWAQTQRVPVKDSDLDDFGRTTKRKVLEVMRADVDIPDYRKEGPVPEFRPVIGSLFVASDGTILMKRLDTSEKPYDLYDSEGRMKWLTLASDGSVTAQFSLPITLDVLAFRDCRIYGRMHLKDGTPIMRRYLAPGCTQPLAP